MRTPRQNWRVLAWLPPSGSAGALLTEAGDDGRPRQLEVQRHRASLGHLLPRDGPGGRGAGQDQLLLHS